MPGHAAPCCLGVAGIDFETLTDDAAFDAAFAALGMKPGDSTIGRVGEPGKLLVFTLK